MRRRRNLIRVFYRRQLSEELLVIGVLLLLALWRSWVLRRRRRWRWGLWC
jgi:hypothetical protein